MVTLTGELSLPLSSFEVILKMLSPSLKRTVYDQVVLESMGTTSLPFIQIEVFAPFVPDKVWVILLVGEVTGSRVGVGTTPIFSP
jgi:hypothetical protein